MADQELAYIEEQLELMKDAPYDGYTIRLYAVDLLEEVKRLRAEVDDLDRQLSDADWIARGDSA